MGGVAEAIDDADGGRAAASGSKRAGEASGRTASSAMAAASVVLLWGAAALLVGPRADVPLIDDWVYASSVERLLLGKGSASRASARRSRRRKSPGAASSRWYRDSPTRRCAARP